MNLKAPNISQNNLTIEPWHTAAVTLTTKAKRIHSASAGMPPMLPPCSEYEQ